MGRPQEQSSKDFLLKKLKHWSVMRKKASLTSGGGVGGKRITVELSLNNKLRDETI